MELLKGGGMDLELLKELGFETAHKEASKKLDLKRRMMLAYEHFRFVEPHIMERFQSQLKVKTLKILQACPKCKNNQKHKETCTYCRQTGAQEQTYDKLQFTPLSKYREVPPQEALLDLKRAKDMNIFDTFEVAKVESVVERPDPIIFGQIEGCDDRFYIAQWDNDVKITDILNESEG